MMTDRNYETMRRAMVASQLRTTAVSDGQVLEMMGTVPRELFVEPAHAAFAYMDRTVPLPGGRALNLPMATGRLLTEGAPRAADRVLLVGAASGYTAALLAPLVASVVALEEDAALPGLARVARPGNVSFVQGPLADGWSEAGPYDLILIDGVVERIPDALVAQLAEGGRLAAGLVQDGVSRLVIGNKAGGGFGTTAFADAAGTPLPGFAMPATFSF